ncbi:MAG TPA: ClpX C4-type zinc finger protein [Polyangia bacterium]|nr:ClpX C4-type zinc finger protein [Polyangia bacterium]
MAQQRAGQCTFCGKSRREVFALVGVAGGAVRICDECTELFLVVLTEDPPDRYHPSLRRAACSFCQRPRAEVGRLLSGPRVFICDRCVDEAGRVVARGSSLRA